LSNEDICVETDITIHDYDNIIKVTNYLKKTGPIYKFCTGGQKISWRIFLSLSVPFHPFMFSDHSHCLFIPDTPEAAAWRWTVHMNLEFHS